MLLAFCRKLQRNMFTSPHSFCEAPPRLAVFFILCKANQPQASNFKLRHYHYIAGDHRSLERPRHQTARTRTSRTRTPSWRVELEKFMSQVIGSRLSPKAASPAHYGRQAALRGTIRESAIQWIVPLEPSRHKLYGLSLRPMLGPFSFRDSSSDEAVGNNPLICNFVGSCR
jgi:hypothetical protein